MKTPEEWAEEIGQNAATYIRAALEEQRERLAAEVDKQCRYCDGSGARTETGSEHHPDCDGECRNCPVPVPIQVQCEGEAHGIAAAIREEQA